MNVGKVRTAMSLQDKVAFCTGGDFWRTKQLEQYGIGCLNIKGVS